VVLLPQYLCPKIVPSSDEVGAGLESLPAKNIHIIGAVMVAATASNFGLILVCSRRVCTGVKKNRTERETMKYAAGYRGW
jgi:hypothetical protein